jgi:AcrR family transcriptional regulator
MAASTDRVSLPAPARGRGKIGRPASRSEKRAARPRNPRATVEALLEAAREVLSQQGSEGLHVTEVARRAGVTRATAYLHFPTRERLMEATVASVSDRLFNAVFADPAFAPGQPLEAVHPRDMIGHLSGFAMEHPELCRAWLHEVLSAESPAMDRFWNRYMAAMRRFASSDLAQPDIDVEVHSVLMLAGTFLWPVWTRAKASSARQRHRMAERFTSEMLRLTLNGVVRPEQAAAFQARVRKRR